jgi:hypothetical protein
MSDVLVNNAFPASLVRVVAHHMHRAPGIEHVFMRPLRDVDPSRSVGVFSFDWVPGTPMIGQADPGTAAYNLRIEVFVKHANEEEGLILHSVLSKSVRAMLYRDADLRAELTMTDTLFDVVERTKDFRVLTQRFMAREGDQGTYLYRSYMDVAFNMEQVRV